MMMKFDQFMDGRLREERRKLRILAEAFRRNSLDVDERLLGSSPHVYVQPPMGHYGIRVYLIGEDVAFRTQQDPESPANGRAYPLDVDGMFETILADETVGEDEAGDLLIAELGKAVRQFFRDTSRADLTATDPTEPELPGTF